MNRWSVMAQAIAKAGPCAMVSVVGTAGSTPRDEDAWMVVTPNGFHGSIGGGTVEWRAMAEAQQLLATGSGRRIFDYVLGPDLGQCCGGRMKIEIEILTAADNAVIEVAAAQQVMTMRQIYLFGAGHIARALVLALAPLPCVVHWIDSRVNAFPGFMPGNVSTHTLQTPTDILNNAAHGSLVYVMTHSHALDFEIVDAALRCATVAHVGLVGSATKRARFEKRLHEAGLPQQKIEELICPIGVAGITSKHPASIAAAVAAQILQLDAQLSQVKVESKSRTA